MPPTLFSALHDETIRALVVTRFKSLTRDSPRSHGMIPFSTALTATHGVVDRVHSRSTHRGADPQPTLTTCLTDGDVLMVHVTHLTDGGITFRQHVAGFTA